MSLLGLPAYRSKDNTRPGIVMEAPQPKVDSYLVNPSSALLRNTTDLPYCLQLSRATPSTVTLANFHNNEVIYTVRDTGRGLLSRKPDYEVFRGSVESGLLVGSVKIGKRGVEVKLPTIEREVKDVEEWDLGGIGLGTGKWEVIMLARGRTRRGSMKNQSEEVEDKAIAVLECCKKVKLGEDDNNTDGNRICTVKLVDTFPNGSIQVWDPKANVDASGDWGLLDEIVTVAYANMEKARRRCMTGPTYTYTDVGAGAIPGFMAPSMLG